MKFLKAFIQNELQHYLHLTPQSKSILQSISLFNIASPILSTFISAFLWRVSGSIELVILYNVAIYCGSPVGFFLNGRLLRRFNPTTIYFLGSTTQGIAAASLLFLPGISLPLIVLFGVFYGITCGFYWSNRIFLIIMHVNSHQRVYFTSLIFISSVLCNIVVPLVIGWYLVLGERTNTYSPTLAYQILGIALMIVMFFAGKKMREVSHEHTPIPYTTLRRPSLAWQKVRIMTFLNGITNSIDLVFPTLLILLFIGKEGKLGTIQAVSGLFLAAALYIIAKRVGKSKRKRYYVLVGGIFISILAGLFFSMWYSVLGVICYFVLSAFALPIRFTSIGPVSFDIIDAEARKYTKDRYAFVFDQELFINIGRLTSLIGFLLFYAYNSEMALRFTPLLFALPQLGILYLAASLEKHLIIDELHEQSLVYNHVLALHEENDYTNLR